MLPAQPNQSLIDGLACLQALAVAGEAIGSRELARRLGLEPTRANRLLKTLAHLGMARQTDARRYVPGPAMHVLSAQSLFGSGLVRRALPVLEQLRSAAEVIALGVLWRDQVCYLYHASGEMPAGEALGRVGLYPATRSGIGLALLAQQDSRQLHGLFGGRDIPGFPGGLPDLEAHLAQVRSQGYARVQLQPRTITLGVGVGAPPYAALAASGDFSEKQQAVLVDRLAQAARAIASPSATFQPGM